MALTEQRDELTLLRSLLDVILEMLPGVEAALIWLVPGTERGQWIKDETCALPPPMFPIDDGLLAAAASLDSAAPDKQLDLDGQSYLISSLGILEGRRKLIIIRQPKWSSSDLRTAQGMVRIHANYANTV